MIQTNELRLGNWVMFEGRYFQIHSIAETYPTLNTPEFGIGVVDWNNIEGVPITPDILLKAGFVGGVGCYDYGYTFVRDRSGDKYKAVLGMICWSDGTIEAYIKNYQIKGEHFKIKGSSAFLAECQHVHTLQNIFHSLTGTELNITLP